MLTAAVVLVAGTLCGADAQEFLWDSVRGDSLQEARVALTEANFLAFKNPESRQAFLDVMGDVLSLGKDLDAGTIAKAVGREGISVDAAEEWIAAINYYRDASKPGNPIIGGLIDFVGPSAPGATRNLSRVAGASSVEAALGEMLEPIAMRRMGVTPDRISGFGVKIDVTRYQLQGVTTGTIEADALLIDKEFHDAKWGTYAANIKQEQIDNLKIILADTTFPDRPIARAVFPLNSPLDPVLQSALDSANAEIRAARGITDSSVIFIEARDVGGLR